jgi:hypothetical protein
LEGAKKRVARERAAAAATSAEATAATAEEEAAAHLRPLVLAAAAAVAELAVAHRAVPEGSDAATAAGAELAALAVQQAALWKAAPALLAAARPALRHGRAMEAVDGELFAAARDGEVGQVARLLSDGAEPDGCKVRRAVCAPLPSHHTACQRSRLLTPATTRPNPCLLTGRTSAGTHP